MISRNNVFEQLWMFVDINSNIIFAYFNLIQSFCEWEECKAIRLFFPQWRLQVKIGKWKRVWNVIEMRSYSDKIAWEHWQYFNDLKISLWNKAWTPWRNYILHGLKFLRVLLVSDVWSFKHTVMMTWAAFHHSYQGIHVRAELTLASDVSQSGQELLSQSGDFVSINYSWGVSFFSRWR